MKPCLWFGRLERPESFAKHSNIRDDIVDTELKKLCYCPRYPSRTCVVNSRKKKCGWHRQILYSTRLLPRDSLTEPFFRSSVLFLRSVFNRRNRRQFCFGDSNRGTGSNIRTPRDLGVRMLLPVRTVTIRPQDRPKPFGFNPNKLWINHSPVLVRLNETDESKWVRLTNLSVYDSST